MALLSFSVMVCGEESFIDCGLALIQSDVCGSRSKSSFAARYTGLPTRFLLDVSVISGARHVRIILEWMSFMPLPVGSCTVFRSNPIMSALQVKSREYISR